MMSQFNLINHAGIVMLRVVMAMFWFATSSIQAESANMQTQMDPLKTASNASSVRVMVWDERQPEQRVGYGHAFLGETLAKGLRGDSHLWVSDAFLDEADQGLSEERLNQTDVLVWWSHRRNDELSDAAVARVKQRVLSGQLALIALHSAHWSRPFVELMQERAKWDARQSLPAADRDRVSWVYHNESPYRKLLAPDAAITPRLERLGDECHLTLPACVFPFYRADGKSSELEAMLPDHPIVAGLPVKWRIPQSEMYGNPFHVPKPDALIYRETFECGREFDTACLWRISAGWVFYFGPGHEAYPIYQQEFPVKVIAQAAKWLAAQH